ncbi:MFS transporter [Oscillospiraceae bacterium 42-9]
MANANNKKFTKTEKSWIMYDWANSVYATNILAVIFPIYFGNVCAANGADNLVLWSYGTSISTFVVAILAPVLGALADHKGHKMRLFAGFLAIGVLFTLTSALFDEYRMLLVGYVLSHIGFSGSCLFYDSFLTDVTTNERMDNMLAFKLVILLTSLWWAVFSIPFLRNVRQVHYIEPQKNLVRSTLSNLLHTAKDIFAQKHIFLFIIAYFFYIDGVGTIISVSTSYGSKLGLDNISMILALLMTQIVAVPFSILFGKLAGKLGALKALCGAVAMYFFITLVGFFMGFNIENHPDDPGAVQLSLVLFWCMAFLVGTVQGGIQAISRSHFGKLIPAERSNEYFGFFDIFGKFAAVIGPMLVALFTQLTGRDSLGVISLAVLFLVGLVLLLAGQRQAAGQK